MSDHYILDFSFGLNPHLPTNTLGPFIALAENRQPSPEQLSLLPKSVRGYFADKDSLLNNPKHHGSPVLVQETGIINNPDNAFHALEPTHHIRCTFTMHDDWYDNGGYGLALAMFDLVGDHGLFCTLYEQGTRQSLSLYYKEFDDLLIVSLNAPNLASPLPPYADVEPDRYLQG